MFNSESNSKRRRCTVSNKSFIPRKKPLRRGSVKKNNDETDSVLITSDQIPILGEILEKGKDIALHLLKLLNIYPIAKTEEELMNQLRKNLQRKYQTLVEVNDDYFEKFLENGCVLLGRLMSNDSFKMYTKDIEALFMDDSERVVSAILILVKILSSQQLLMSDSLRKEANVKTCLIMESLDIQSEAVVCFEGIYLMKTGTAKGLFLIFMSHFAFGLDYDIKIRKIMLCIEKFIMKWPHSSLEDHNEISTIGEKLMLLNA